VYNALATTNAQPSLDNVRSRTEMGGLESLVTIWEPNVADELLRRIRVDPETMVGKPVIHGTRVPVELIVRLLAHGSTYDEILADYPRLSPEDIQAALLYAATVLANEDVFPLPSEVA
jgi:uncharacterized protein (DUF433 family)